jgi:putative endopeptidase
MKKLIVASLTLAICVGTASGQKKSTQKKVKTVSKKASALPPGTKFIEPRNMNKNVAPGDNFYEFANGAWLRDNGVPASETRWGSFNILNDYTQKSVKKILDETSKTSGAKGTPEQMVGDFYASGMNEAAIEKLGINAIAPNLMEIEGINDYQGLINYLGSSQRKGLNGLIGIYVGADDKDVTKNVLNFFQGGLGLPDRDYYFKEDERMKKIRPAYEAYIAEALILAGSKASDAKVAAKTIMGIETELAKASMGRVEMRDPYKLYNKMDLNKLSEITGGFNWKSWLKDIGIPNQNEVIVAQPEFLKAVMVMLKTKQVEDWKSYLRFHLISGMSPYMSKAFDEARFNFYGKTLRGQKEQKPRWKRVSATVDGGVGMQIGKIYVKKYFTPEAKTRMLAMVNNLQAVYGERIQALPWMSVETKEKAMEKLNSFMKKIGYPDTWKDYTGLVIDKNNYVQNILRSNEFDNNFNMSKLGKPVDRSEWGMTPPTINAYYNPAYNEIVFPAGILQFPFFDFDADDAVIYGGIGAVIGHEMTHGFDDQGAQYAADGNLKDWWTEADKAKFKTLTDAVVKQYNEYTVLDTMHVNGELTQGENIADLGGVTIAYEAFKRTPQFMANKTIDGFSPVQRFFMSWAQVWRANTTPEEMATRIATDPHSPGIHRCNGPLTNFTPFYEAFNVTPENKMYKTPADRLKVW